MMASKALRVLVPGLLLPAFMSHAGGWAVITVDDLPDHAEVGKPLALTYMVRQHGFEAHDGLHGSVEATSGGRTIKGTVRADGRKRGHYAALVTLPSAGNWAITIKSGFGKSDLTLLPLPALAPGATARPVTDAERGQHLFVAKGCVTCHVQYEVGPRLDGRRFDPTYLARYLANPTPIAPQAGRPRMPNLGLQQREIASLVAYLNSGTQLGVR